MASNSGGGGSSGRPRIPLVVRVIWACAAVTVAATFPVLAMLAQVFYGWELTWQWVTLYSTGILGFLFAAFGIPVAFLLRRNGSSKPK